MRITYIIFVSIAFLTLAQFSEAKDKYLKVEKVTQCVNSENLPIQILFSQVNKNFKKNIVSLNSTVGVSKKIDGMLQVRILSAFIKLFF